MRIDPLSGAQLADAAGDMASDIEAVLEGGLRRVKLAAPGKLSEALHRRSHKREGPTQWLP
jgi:hypothetical protein